MKKLLGSLFIALFLCGVSLPVLADTATVNTPQNEKGDEAHPLYGGYKYYRLPQGAAAEKLVCLGYCLLVDVVMQTGANTAYVQLRDSITADGSGGSPVFQFSFVSVRESSPAGKLQYPVRFNNGITASLSAQANSEAATIIYLPIGKAN